MRQGAPGKTILRICGILLIFLSLFSLFAIIGSILLINMLADPNSQIAIAMEQAGEMAQLGVEATPELYMQAAVLGSISFVLYLVSGIVGVAFANRIEKAKVCLICIGLVLVYEVASAVYSAIGGGFSVLNAIFILVVPILYLWGAMKNLDADRSAGAELEP